MLGKLNTPTNLRGYLNILRLLLLVWSTPLWSQVPVGTSIENVARFAYHTTGGVPRTASSDTTVTTVSAGYQVHILKSANTTVVTPGDSLIYTITLHNSGNISTGELSVIDTLNAHLTHIESDPPASVQGQVLAWTISNLEAGQIMSIQIVTDLSSQTPPGTNIENTASIHIGTDAPMFSELVSVSTGSFSDLALTKTVDKATALSNDTLTYTLQLINIGNTLSPATYMRDDLPDILDAVHISGNGSQNGDIITWNIGNLAPGDTAREIVRVVIPDLTPINTTLINSASATNGIGVSRLSQSETLVNPWVISMTKSAERGPYEIGDTIAYHLQIDNDSSSEIYDVIVIDTLLSPLQLISTNPAAQINGNVVSWYLGSMQPFTSRNMEILAEVGSTNESLSVLINRAHVRTINGGTNQDTAAVDLLLAPHIYVEKHAVSTVVPGDTLQYSLRYGNDGLVQATGVTLMDSLPEEVELLGANVNYAYDEVTHVVTWELGDLQPDTQDSISVKTLVSMPLPDQSQLLNSAWLISNEVNSDTVTVTTTVESEPVLQLIKSGPEISVAGDTLQYSLETINLGTATSTQTMLVDSLPSELIYLESSMGGVYHAATHTVQWDVGELRPGISTGLTLTAMAQPGLNPGSQIVNHARIYSSEGVEANSSTSTLFRSPRLELTLTSDSSTVIAGSTFLFHIGYQNLGDTLATEVVLIDSLPEYLEFVSAADGIYNSESHTVTWTLEDLSPEMSRRSSKRTKSSLAGIKDLEVRVISPITNNTVMHNRVNISCAQNVVADAWINVTALSGPFIALSKLGDLEVFPGDTINYELQYENVGTDVAHNVMVVDTLDQRLTFLDVQNPAIYNSNTRVLTWSLGDLEAGESGTLNFRVLISSSLDDGEQVSNHAWVHSDETHPHRSTWATTNILPMSMTLESSPKVIMGNGESTSTLTARVYSFLGNPAPDGIPVSFVTNKGTIPAELDTVMLNNGVAYSSIIADTVVSQAATARIDARAFYSPSKFASDTTEVVFIIGAFVGNIYDINGNPIQDVLVELIRISTGEMVGLDSTDASGYYLIPVYYEEEYLIRYSWVDEYGNLVVYEQIIVIQVPENGQISTNLNSISGWIFNELTGAPIIESGIEVILSSDSTTTLAKTPTIISSDTSYTDSTGRYFFTNLLPGQYDLKVNYRGVQSYSDGSIQVNLTQPGVFIANANISLRQSPYYIYKTVDQVEAMIGDTLDYSLRYGAHQTVIDSVFIVDYLPQGLHFIATSIESDAQTNLALYDELENKITFTRNSVPLGDEFQLNFKAVIQRHVNTTLLENRAIIASQIDTSYSYRDTRTHAKTQLIFPFLKITKSVNRRVAEPGDYLTYTVKLENVSAEESAVGLGIYDLIPQGFKYRSATSYLDGEPLENPLISEAANRQQQLTWTLVDTLDPGSSMTLKYRLICGINSPMGYAVNQVYAQGQTPDGFPVGSNIAQATVEVRPGILSNRGIILGKVFYDENLNGIQDYGEKTQSEVELIMENGTRVYTDKDGKYSIPNVTPGIHVIRVNESSLPEGVLLPTTSFNHLKNGKSQLIQMGGGAMLKVNIPLSLPVIKPSLIQGFVYLDLNENLTFDESDQVYSGAQFVLNDSLPIVSDSLGQFVVKDLLPGSYQMAFSKDELPPYIIWGSTMMDTNLIDDSQWSFETAGDDTIHVAVALSLKEMEVALANHATLQMNTRMLTQEFRLLVYKPWSMLLRIGFESGRATLTDEVLPELRRVGELLRWQPQLNLDINGHTDNVPLAANGNFADNQALSQARAQSIQSYLVNNMRVDPARIKATGFGDSQPLLENASDEARTLNRRVEMVFYNAQSEDSKYSQLDFEFEIDYSGEITLDSIAFNQILPPGFAYKENTGKLQGVTADPISSSDTSVTWGFGAWNRRHDEVFDFAMQPSDFEKIAPTSTVTTFLEYTDPLGQRVITDSLETRLSTLVEELSFNMVLKGTQFDVGSADLKSSAFAGLYKLGEFMTWQTGINIVVEGFTDDRGRLELNMELSRQRAESVKSYLLSNFDINPDRIQVHGMGPHYPVASNETWAGRASNRRVEVLVNAVVGEAAIMEIEILKEALMQELSYPLDPFAPEWADSTTAVNKGQATSFWVNMIDPVPMDYDQVKLVLELPEGIQSARNATQKIVLLVDVDESRTVHELIELRSEESLPEGFYQIEVVIQRLKAGEVVGPAEQRQVELRFK
jgi:uncharacterized repeat protein (TIGR01451 family)